MALVFTEAADSRETTLDVNSDTVRLRWNAMYEDDEATVRAGLLVATPTTWDDKSLVGVQVLPRGSSGIWDCTAEYAFSPEVINGPGSLDIPGPDDPLDPSVSFDLTAQTAHITQSLATLAARISGDNANGWAQSTVYAHGDEVVANGNLYTCGTGGTSSSSGTGPSGTGSGIHDGTVIWSFTSSYPDINPNAPDFSGAIGVTSDQVHGTDIFVGHLEFGVLTQLYPVTCNVILDLLEAVGTINEAEWFNFPAKSVIYLGATGTCKPGDIWTVQHRFGFSPELTDIPIGPNIVVALKAGWDYLWTTYQAMQVGNYLLQVPQAAYVEQVYRTSDFDLIPV